MCVFFIRIPCFLMCILFYVSFTWLHMCVFAINFTVHCGMPSRALLGFPITAPPPVYVPDVIGALAMRRQNKTKNGSAPHQCRWAGVVWVVRCRVMGCCGVWLFFVDLLFLVNSHMCILGLGVLLARLLGLCCTATFPPIFLQLR